jgi:hypothetical protein
LKPANVLLTADGTPKITDFGLAKVLSDSPGAEQTQSGAVIGTPSYMAPEQAAARREQVGPAADIWSLGVILYELLTGRPPFQADTTLETLLLVQNEDPVAPRRLRPAVPRDLEWVCLKCLRKEPERRYAGAAQLAEELRRFLAGLPLRHTRPVGATERAWRWCRRNPAVALLLAALGLSLVGGLAFSLGFAWRAEVEAGIARTQKGVAEQETERAKQKEAETRAAKEQSDRSLYQVSMQLAQQAWEEGTIDRLRDLLERQRPERTGGVDLRGFEWHYWWGRLHTDLLTLNTPPGSGALACSPDGRYLVGGTVGQVTVWDATTGKEVWSAGTGRQVAGVAWAPDGKRVAGLGNNGVLQQRSFVRVWDAATGRQLRMIMLPVLPGLSLPFTGDSLTFSPNGKRLAAHVTSPPNTSSIMFWDADTGQRLPSLVWEQSVAFSPRGHHMAGRRIDGPTARRGRRPKFSPFPTPRTRAFVGSRSTRPARVWPG